MPRPPCERASEWSTWVNRPKTSSSISGAIPMPLSRTRMMTRSSSVSAWTSIRPPVSVYFTAFVSRLFSTCSSRKGSAQIRTASSGIATRSSCCLASRSGRIVSSERRMIAERSTGSFRSWILPRVIRETSSRSSTRRAMQRTCCSTTSRMDSRSSGSLPFSRMACTALRMGARGLRSSWASMARNSSLRWSAMASSAIFCRSSSSSRLRSLMSRSEASRAGSPSHSVSTTRISATRTSESESGRSTSVVPPAMTGMPKYRPTSSEAGRSISLVAAGLT